MTNEKENQEQEEQKPTIEIHDPEGKEIPINPFEARLDLLEHNIQNIFEMLQQKNQQPAPQPAYAPPTNGGFDQVPQDVPPQAAPPQNKLMEYLPLIQSMGMLGNNEQQPNSAQAMYMSIGEAVVGKIASAVVKDGIKNLGPDHD